LGRTWLRRPDLLSQRGLDAASRALLDEFRREHASGQSTRQDDAVE
jgi:tRNA (guanine37-N1)-methyltransferase